MANISYENIYREKQDMADLERYHARHTIYTPKEKFKINNRDIVLGSACIICCIAVGVMAYVLSLPMVCK